ncbi:hypothetical protein RKE29_20425 [Streptomyces sp. B1866]|uniref:hypothetical protein n=1 Tax=Streptomyces sp. B1866 TaxID=3075431 RepID=UPI00288DD512|nr:hypothetical protein [Streptomyces sp. B1866]MDT3398979.1 hypothetical protein [Streptomyces sp. B1866]
MSWIPKLTSTAAGKQTLLLGAVILLVLAASRHQDDEGDRHRDPSPGHTARYPVSFDHDDRSDKNGKGDRNGQDKTRRPRPAVSYPIRFHHPDSGR